MSGANVVRFEVIDHISIPSPTSDLNEDAVGAANNAAWVIDGATGVSDLPPLVPFLSDAAWLAMHLNDGLQAAFARSPVEPSAALRAIESGISAQFNSANQLQDRTPIEQPTAAFALSVLDRDTVHLLGLGDCRIIVENQAGEIQQFDPSDRAHAELLIIQERARLLATYPGEDPWPRLKPFIRSLREFANMEYGYSIVHPTLAWHDRVKRQTLHAQAVRHLLAVSDGLYRLVDVFAMLTPDQLLRRAVEDGLAPLCSELRARETADDRGLAYPRVKTYDDASAVLVRLR
jgi:hypothetical protein